MQRGVVSSSLSVLPTSQVFTSGYVNMETILHFFYKITNERASSCNEGKRHACSSSITVLKTNLKQTVFTYAHVKWFYGQSERAYYFS